MTDSTSPPKKIKSGVSKYILIGLGILSVSLGIIGIFLPILPTTPFALLAAFFFSKSSDRLHKWLLDQKTLGPLIKDWQRHGVIRLKIKILATSMMIVLFSYTLIFVNVPVIIKAIISLIGICVLAFIWTRPSEKKLTNNQVQKGTRSESAM